MIPGPTSLIAGSALLLGMDCPLEGRCDDAAFQQSDTEFNSAALAIGTAPDATVVPDRKGTHE